MRRQRPERRVIDWKSALWIAKQEQRAFSERPAVMRSLALLDLNAVLGRPRSVKPLTRDQSWRLSRRLEWRRRTKGYTIHYPPAYVQVLLDRARAKIVCAPGLPSEFDDWEEKEVGLNFHLLGEDEPIFADHWVTGIPIGIRKRGRWFVLRSLTGSTATKVEVIPVASEEALTVPHLPTEWEDRVGIVGDL